LLEASAFGDAVNNYAAWPNGWIAADARSKKLALPERINAALFSAEVSLLTFIKRPHF
jgi:hypothetical protein